MKEKLVLDISDIDGVSQICHAMASPIRLRILALLDEKPLIFSGFSSSSARIRSRIGEAIA